MPVIFTKHAKTRMGERNISEDFILKALDAPEKILVSSRRISRFIVKKFYRTEEKKNHLLMIIAERRADGQTVVVTVIDTSKVDKYY